MNIAIIGAGKNTEALAKGLADAGHEIYIGLKDMETYVSPELLEAFDNIYLVSIEDAARESDVIVITTPAHEVREVVYMLNDVRRKTIVDLSSFNFVRATKYVNTHSVIKAISNCQNLVKCYDVTGYEDLVNPDFVGATTDMFMAGDSKKSKEMVKLLARDLGFIDCCDFGDSGTISMLDEMSNCWNNRAVKQKVVASLAYKLVKK
jgi:predicted dinucleotide-binding enzyme